MYRTRVQPGGLRRPTRDDVARQANISGATVSRVLSGRTDLAISPETRAKVLEAAEQLGYRPNTNARALTTGRTGLIGFWMSLQYSRYRSQVLDRMRGLLGETELALAVTDVDEEYQWDHSFDRPLRVPTDGIIAFDNSASVEAFARQHDRLVPHTPYLSMGAYWSETKSYVGVNLRAGADAAMAHLIGAGHKNIEYLVPYNSDLLRRGPRYEAYSSAVTGIGVAPIIIPVESVRLPDVKEALASRLSTGPAPDAILCMNDDLAISAVFALGQLGLTVGKDIAIVGFDGIEEGEYCPCPITTVRQPIDEMCHLAYQFLKVQLDDPSASLQQRILSPELVIRESSGS